MKITQQVILKFPIYLHKPAIKENGSDYFLFLLKENHPLYSTNGPKGFPKRA
jgi:hypothetical protein